jgi:hypothetical protein
VILKNLYQILLSKRKFDQVHCVDMVTRSPTKFTLYFYKLYFIFYKFSKFLNELVQTWTATLLASLHSQHGHHVGWLLNGPPHRSILPWLDRGKEWHKREREMQGALWARSQQEVLTRTTAPGGLGWTMTTTSFGLGPAHGKRAQSSEGKRGHGGGGRWRWMLTGGLRVFARFWAPVAEELKSRALADGLELDEVGGGQCEDLGAAVTPREMVAMAELLLDHRQVLEEARAGAKKHQLAMAEMQLLTAERAITHEHDLVQKLLVTGAPTSQTGMCCRSDRCAASASWTRNLLLGRDPIGEGVSWVDLASTGQLDLPPSAARTKGDKKLGFGKEELGFGDEK